MFKELILSVQTVEIYYGLTKYLFLPDVQSVAAEIERRQGFFSLSKPHGKSYGFLKVKSSKKPFRYPPHKRRLSPRKFGSKNE